MREKWIKALAFDLNWRVVAFIGGGGKTTAIEALADELAALGKSVLVTTTTKIWYPQKRCYEIVLRETFGVSREFKDKLAKSCRKGAVVVSGDGVSDQGKILGHTLDTLEEISSYCDFDVILIEADGSKGRSLKAHQQGEPQVPRYVDFCYILLGADVLGKPLNEEWVHRSKQFTKMTDTRLESPISPDLVANFYKAPGGYQSKIPMGCSSAVVLTKVSSLSRYGQVKRLVQRLPEISFFVAPIIQQPSVEVFEPCQASIRGILLAAGSASRFGSCKQLHQIMGKTFVEWMTGMLLATNLKEVVVVYKDDEVRTLLHQKFSEAVKVGRLFFAYNENANEGQSTSVKIGVQAQGSNMPVAPIDGFMFIMADQLLLNEETINKLLQSFKHHSITVPSTDGKLGAPAIFSSDFKWELVSILGDQGGRDIIKRHQGELIKVFVLPETLLDVDTQEDLNDLIKMME